MLTSETLHLESARAVEALAANNIKLLHNAGNTFHVKVTTREGWIRVEGEEEDVARAIAFLRELAAARQNGVKISTPDFNYALRAAEKGEPVRLGEIANTRIEASTKKGFITARTAGQKEYIQAMMEKDLVLGIGPAGTGKTYLAVAMAVHALKTGAVKRIVLTRPAVEAGEALGFLPGDYQQKVYPYLRPLYDALQDMLDLKEVQTLLDQGVLEVAPLAYMRGRTLNNAFIILDEAQNTTREQMFMFLTRLGAESKCVVTGDPTQVDLPGRTPSGLIEAMHALRDIPGLHFSYLTEEDVVRHELVHAIIVAYRKFRSPADN
jgi:phosphate starvation-inducible PhoH-like protein